MPDTYNNRTNHNGLWPITIPGCSCGCHHPRPTTAVAVNGMVIRIRGLIELLMPIAEAATPPDGTDYDTILSEMRCSIPMRGYPMISHEIQSQQDKPVCCLARADNRTLF